LWWAPAIVAVVVLPDLAPEAAEVRLQDSGYSTTAGRIFSPAMSIGRLTIA
jgi:hypothetical protein